MHLVNIKLHNCRKSTIKSNTGSTKLHDCGDISLCWGVSRPAISTFVTGEGKSGSAAVHTKQYCSAWAVDGHARALRFHYSINKLSPQYLSSSSSDDKWRYWTSNCLYCQVFPHSILYSCAMQDQHNQLTVVTRELIALKRGLNCVEFKMHMAIFLACLSQQDV